MVQETERHRSRHRNLRQTEEPRGKSRDKEATSGPRGRLRALRAVWCSKREANRPRVRAKGSLRT